MMLLRSFHAPVSLARTIADRPSDWAISCGSEHAEKRRASRWISIHNRSPQGLQRNSRPMPGASLTAASEQAILDWCAKYSLLGVLLHCVMQVVLPAHAGRQIQYGRIGFGWIPAQ